MMKNSLRDSFTVVKYREGAPGDPPSPLLPLSSPPSPCHALATSADAFVGQVRDTFSLEESLKSQSYCMCVKTPRWFILTSFSSVIVPHNMTGPLTVKRSRFGVQIKSSIKKCFYLATGIFDKCKVRRIRYDYMHMCFPGPLPSPQPSCLVKIPLAFLTAVKPMAS